MCASALHSYSVHVVVCVALVSVHWLAKELEGLTYAKAKNAP